MTGSIHTMTLLGALAVLPLLAGGCDSDNGDDGDGAGTQQDTSGVIADAAADKDAATDADASAADTSAKDAAAQADASAPDAGQTDTAQSDTAKPDASTADASATPTCAEMSKKLYADLSAVVAAHQACSTGDTCVIAQTSTACAGACGQAVNKSGLAAVQKVVNDLDINLCKANGYAGKCGYSTPSCAKPNPACEQGKCVYHGTEPASPCGLPQPAGTECVNKAWVCKKGYFHASPTAKACVEATCKNMISAHGELIGGVAAGLKACSQDADCVVVPTSTACQGACGVAVNAAEAQVLKTSLAWADEHICKANGYASQCGYATPKCMAPKPGCKAGACVYTK